jgi:hypothetical protein
VSLEDTLFGTQVVAHSVDARTMSFRLEEPQEDVQTALAAYLRGMAARGANLRDLPALHVPINPMHLVEAHDNAFQTLTQKLDRYRELRAEVDERISNVLAG